MTRFSPAARAFFALVGLGVCAALAVLGVAYTFAPRPAHALVLTDTTHIIEVVTSSTSAIDVEVSYVDYTTTSSTAGAQNTAISTATTTTVLAAPAASTQREVRKVNIRNKGTANNTITVQKDVSGTNYELFEATLLPEGELLYTQEGEWRVYDSAGRLRTTFDPPGFNGKVFIFTKVATATDATSYHYLANKDNGFPGAWSVGTPGVNGVVTACDVVGTAGTGGALSTGSPVLPDPATGGWYLTRFGVGGVAAVNTYALHDIVWYNTGLTVTTTTAQAITSPAFPARDDNGSTNGEGYQIALYALTALGNAAAVSNSTVQYTNSAGTATRTATFSGAVGFQAPATPVIGTFMPFQLQAGDTGVRSIQSVTLNTTYTSGTMMLIVYRTLALDGAALANGPSGSLVMRNAVGVNPGIRVWNDTCFAVGILGATATTAPSFTAGSIELMER